MDKHTANSNQPRVNGRGMIKDEEEVGSGRSGWGDVFPSFGSYY